MYPNEDERTAVTETRIKNRGKKNKKTRVRRQSGTHSNSVLCSLLSRALNTNTPQILRPVEYDIALLPNTLVRDNNLLKTTINIAHPNIIISARNL